MKRFFPWAEAMRAMAWWGGSSAGGVVVRESRLERARLEDGFGIMGGGGGAFCFFLFFFLFFRGDEVVRQGGKEWEEGVKAIREGRCCGRRRVTGVEKKGFGWWGMENVVFRVR